MAPNPEGDDLIGNLAKMEPSDIAEALAADPNMLVLRIRRVCEIAGDAAKGEGEDVDDDDTDALRAMSLSEISALYDMIAEGRTLEALELIYNESGHGDRLLYPSTQLNLAKDRART